MKIYWKGAGRKVYGNLNLYWNYIDGISYYSIYSNSKCILKVIIRDEGYL